MVNLIAIVGAAVASMVLGFVWYGPLFGKMWMALSGFKPSDMEKTKTKAQKGYMAMAVTSLVTAAVLSMLLTASASMTLAAGLMTGFWAWLGFIATVSLGSVLWENKPVKLYLLNNGFNLLNLLVMAAILTAFP